MEGLGRNRGLEGHGWHGGWGATGGGEPKGLGEVVRGLEESLGGAGGGPSEL